MLRKRWDRGSVAIEAAILTPALFVILMLGYAAGRTVTAANAISDATHNAARAASLARNPADAYRAAAISAQASLDNSGRSCTTLTAELNPDGFYRPVGQPASITVTVKCVVSYGDLFLLPGLPGTREFTDTFTSPLDQYRARS